MSEENKQTDQQQEGGKVEKKYAQSMLKLQTLMGDRSLGLPTKLGLTDPNPAPDTPVEGETAIDSVIRELFAEEFVKLKAEIKGDLKNLLVKNVEFQRFCKQKEKELADAIMAKKKEFNAEADKVFGKITGIEAKVKETKGALNIQQPDASAEEQTGN